MHRLGLEPRHPSLKRRVRCRSRPRCKTWSRWKDSNLRLVLTKHGFYLLNYFCMEHRDGIGPPRPLYERGIIPLDHQCLNLERLPGIEPGLKPWQGLVLPIYENRKTSPSSLPHGQAGDGDSAETGSGNETQTRFIGLEARGTFYIPCPRNLFTGSYTFNFNWFSSLALLSPGAYSKKWFASPNLNSITITVFKDCCITQFS